jgi:small conductance mechanosensitive channel
MENQIQTAWGKIDGYWRDFMNLLPSLIVSIVLFVIFLIIASQIKHFIERQIAARAKNKRNIGIVLGRIAQWAAIMMGTLISLSVVIPSFKASDLIQLLGIGSVAVGFAFKEVLQNFLAGLIILLTEPFSIGDDVVFAGSEGRVEDIQTRATVLQLPDGRFAIVPNAKLFTELVVVKRMKK